MVYLLKMYWISLLLVVINVSRFLGINGQDVDVFPKVAEVNEQEPINLTCTFENLNAQWVNWFKKTNSGEVRLLEYFVERQNIIFIQNYIESHLHNNNASLSITINELSAGDSGYYICTVTANGRIHQDNMTLNVIAPEESTIETPTKPSGLLDNPPTNTLAIALGSAAAVILIAIIFTMVIIVMKRRKQPKEKEKDCEMIQKHGEQYDISRVDKTTIQNGVVNECMAYEEINMKGDKSRIHKGNGENVQGEENENVNTNKINECEYEQVVSPQKDIYSSVVIPKSKNGAKILVKSNHPRTEYQTVQIKENKPKLYDSDSD